MRVRMCGGGNGITKRTMRGSKLCVESIHAQCYYGARYVNVRATKATLEPHSTTDACKGKRFATDAPVQSLFRIDFHVGGLHKHILMSRSCHAEGWAVEVAAQASAIERSPKAPWPRQALDPFSSRVAGLAKCGWPGKGPLRHHPVRDCSVCCAFSPNPALISRVQYNIQCRMRSRGHLVYHPI